MGRYVRKQRPPLLLRFVKSHGSYRAGDIAEVPYTQALDLVLADIAVPHVRTFECATPRDNIEVR